MRVIYKDSEKQIEKDYPGCDISEPIQGLDSTIQFYWIETIKPENPNPDRYDLIQKPDKLTTKTHPEYKHLKICECVYELVEKSQDEIIERLNAELGNYLDTEYLVPLRDKHARELIVLYSKDTLTDSEIERKNYLLSLNDWLIECRAIRDQRENDYLNNDIFPEFNNYPLKPL